MTFNPCGAGLCRGGPGRSCRGFTLIEMIVVIVIITVLLLVTVPSFNAMMASSEESLAENLLRTSMRTGRDAAMKSGGDRDAAVVFMYEPSTQRTTLLTCVKAGVVQDVPLGAGANPNDPGSYTLRDVFVPLPDVQPALLPKGWMVRGFVPASYINPATPAWDDGWYTDASVYNRAEGNWVFPENGFYDPTAADQGGTRSTFLVRFEAGTGIMKIGDASPALVLSPLGDSNWRDNLVSTFGASGAGFDLSDADDYGEFVQRVGSASPRALTYKNKRSLIGRESTDMVLAKPVGQLALYDEAVLATAIDVRIDRDTGSLYQPPNYLLATGTGGTTAPTPVAGYSQARVNRWMEGDTNNDLSVSDDEGGDRPEAKVFTIDRYTGLLQRVEVQP